MGGGRGLPPNNDNDSGGLADSVNNNNCNLTKENLSPALDFGGAWLCFALFSIDWGTCCKIMSMGAERSDQRHERGSIKDGGSTLVHWGPEISDQIRSIEPSAAATAFDPMDRSDWLVDGFFGREGRRTIARRLVGCRLLRCSSLVGFARPLPGSAARRLACCRFHGSSPVIDHGCPAQ